MIYLNGHFIDSHTANFDLQDRGLLLADGLFETLRCERGNPEHLSRHWRRLEDGCAKLSIRNPISCDEANVTIKKLLHDNQLTNSAASARLTLTRGPGSRGLTPLPHPKVTVLIACTPAPTLPVPPLSLCATPYTRNERSPTVSIKSLCYLDNILAKQFAITNGFDDGILANTSGQIACASHANLFLVKDEVLYTPQLTSGALAGITRQRILELASTFMRTQETEVYENQLMSADEVFITSAIIGIVPIRRYESVYFQVDNFFYTNQLQTALGYRSQDQ